MSDFSSTKPIVQVTVHEAEVLRACSGEGLAAAYQPIIDTARGSIVGYEALVRFPGYKEKNPETWFAAARRHGHADRLEASALRAVLTRRQDLPSNCFLTVNVSPDVLLSSEVRSVWAEQGSLGGVIVELTEQTPIDSYVELKPALNTLRAAGALIAIDDAGSGYAGLQHLLAVKPAMIKIDRSIVQDVHQDEAKRALLEMMGLFASRIDAWILAEGIEKLEELDTLVALGVPLVQGYLLGRPASDWGSLDVDLAHRMLSARVPVSTNTVRDVVERAHTVTSPAAAAEVFLQEKSLQGVVLVHGQQRPVAYLTPDTAQLAVYSQSLTVNLDTPIKECLTRAITRDTANRFDPLLVTDNAGRFAGIVRIERLINLLAA